MRAAAFEQYLVAPGHIPMSTNGLKRPESVLLLPRREFSSCLFAAFVRDTRDANLAHMQRFNHFAATPLCGITIMFEGESHLLDDAKAASRIDGQSLLPRISFAGPQRRPTMSFNPGDIHGVILAFFPEAFALLTGIKIADYVDRCVDAAGVLPAPILDLCEDMLTGAGADERFAGFQEGLSPLWRKARPASGFTGAWVSDWTRSLAMRAATSGFGRSVRQTERRIKAWTGQPMRDLQAYGRSEMLYSLVLEGWRRGDINYAEAAAGAGYSDQSHMGRDIRRQTGFSPAQLRRLIETEEAFWIYRLFGERLL